MNDAWVDRSVFYVVEHESSFRHSLDDLLRLGFNAVCVPLGMPDLDGLIRRAHQRDMRVCVIADDGATQAAEGAADGVLGAQLRLAASRVPRLRSDLFRSSGGPCYFAGHGDFGPFWRTFERARGTSGARLGLFASEHAEPSLGVGRESDEIEVAFAFLMTWPIVPFVRAGDEDGVEAALERLTYLRLTEPDLAPAAPLELLSASSPGYPLVFRRGSSTLIALNASPAAQRVTLPAVGDATPIAARHCHLVHADGRWCARLEPAGYGIFGVT